MKASVVDLRYRMKSVLDALNRNETVTVLYHGRETAVITSIGSREEFHVADHPFFGMKSDMSETVEETMTRLRGGRY